MTEKEKSKRVDKVIEQMLSIREGARLMRQYPFFDHKKYRTYGFDKILKNKCKEFGVKENFVRMVANWETSEMLDNQESELD